MALEFRQRIFVVLVALTAVPTALAVVGWALAVRTVGPSAGARAALEEMAASARQMVDRMDTTHLAPRDRAAVREHLERLSGTITLPRRAETYLRYYAGGFALVVIVFGGLALTAAVRLAGHLSRQLSRPIDELVGWTRLIRRRVPLPAGPASRGAPERSEEHTFELQSQSNIVCRLLLEKKNSQPGKAEVRAQRYSIVRPYEVC